MMPGHRVRMIQFFQNESRQATQQAHQRMLEAANRRAKDVRAAEASNAEELKLLRMRLVELEEEASHARDSEAAAVRAAREAWGADASIRAVRLCTAVVVVVEAVEEEVVECLREKKAAEEERRRQRRRRRHGASYAV